MAIAKPGCWQEGLQKTPEPRGTYWLHVVHLSALQLVGMSHLVQHGHSGWSCHCPLDWDVPRGLCSSPAAPVQVLGSRARLWSPCARVLPVARGLAEVRAAATPAVLHGGFSGFYVQRLAPGRAGAPWPRLLLPSAKLRTKLFGDCQACASRMLQSDACALSQIAD